MAPAQARYLPLGSCKKRSIKVGCAMRRKSFFVASLIYFQGQHRFMKCMKIFENNASKRRREGSGQMMLELLRGAKPDGRGGNVGDGGLVRGQVDGVVDVGALTEEGEGVVVGGEVAGDVRHHAEAAPRAHPGDGLVVDEGRDLLRQVRSEE